MSLIDRRKFILGAASALSLPLLITAENNAANNPNFRFILPNDESTFVVGENVPLRIFTKTQFPRLRVNFKANGQLIGTATNFPYRINWIPAQTGNYNLTAEISTPQMNAVVGTNVNVFNLLYDGIGRRGNRFYNIESAYASYQYYYPVPEMPLIAYGYPMNFVGTLTTARTIKQIDLVFASIDMSTNAPLPLFYSVSARLWNNGSSGFRNSPLGGNLANIEVGTPHYVLNSLAGTTLQGINFFFGGWTNLSIALPANITAALSLQFWIASSLTQRILIAQSNNPPSDLLYAAARNFDPPTFSAINSSAIRIWTD